MVLNLGYLNFSVTPIFSRKKYFMGWVVTKRCKWTLNGSQFPVFKSQFELKGTTSLGITLLSSPEKRTCYPPTCQMPWGRENLPRHRPYENG